MKRLAIVALLLLSGCSALGSMAVDTITGSASNGIEATAQVGKENTKSLVAAKVDTSKSIDIDDIQGNATIGSGNSVTNDATTMIGLVLSGMFFPMLLIFYMLPSPKWIKRRHDEDT